MGLASNAGAAGVMIAMGYAGKAPATAAFFGTVAIGFAPSLAFPERAAAPLW
ncbi:MAG: hypothetical protein AAGM38_16150 [Pseudomonadota bacterium]